MPFDEIGSDMELVDDKYVLDGCASPPWERESGDITYVESGRQALSLVADLLWANGNRTLLVPEFLCDTMVSPFLANPWELGTYRVIDSQKPDLTDLLLKASQLTGGFVVLMALYFGTQPDEAYRAAVLKIQSSGGIVVDDETHRVFAPGGSGAHVAVGSLRKLLPVADGAYIRSLFTVDTGPLRRRESGAGLRWQAMEEKSQALRDSGVTWSYVEAFSEANKQLEGRTDPHQISGRSLDLLGRLNYEMLSSVRVANSSTLALGLSDEQDVQVLNAAGPRRIPSHQLVEVQEPRAVQQALAQEGIFCPIHWPRTQLLERLGAWPSNLLSIPIDHRYAERHMQRIVEVLLRTVKEASPDVH